KAPAGLDIQASVPEEIAVSILAEMIQTKAGKAAAGRLQTADTGSVDRRIPPETRPPAIKPPTAGSVRAPGRNASRLQFREDGRGRDPICGMEVDMAQARHRSEYGSQTFYFCCARCKEKFDQSPERYAAL